MLYYHFDPLAMKKYLNIYSLSLIKGIYSPIKSVFLLYLFIVLSDF